MQSPPFRIGLVPTGGFSVHRQYILCHVSSGGYTNFDGECRAPTALDALAFAYLHIILGSKNDTLRFEVARRVNLVAWEQRVSRNVETAFELYIHTRG
jgi:hypothetical protein